MIPKFRPFALLLNLFLYAGVLGAQVPPKPQPDVLILNDDEKLLGRLVRASGGSVIFKSDLLGEVTVAWEKIKELHTSGAYAVVEKGIKLNRRSDTTKVPKGTLDVAGQTIAVHPESGAAISVPVASSGNVVEAGIFQKDVEHNPGLLEGWAGAITAGASMVQATQQSRAFSGAIHLIRAIPDATWLEPRNRTELGFTASEGFVSQPNTPRVKTEIVHAEAQRDQYFRGSRVYGFGQAIFDHNFSQGLDLQQNYGGGIGWTAINNPSLTLDLKGSIDYVNQEFEVESLNHSLVASTFSQNLVRKLPRGMVLLQQISVTPTWNVRRAWLAEGSASFLAPVYKRLSFSIGVQDNFLNDPPPGFRQNSLQATTGLTYTLR
jgi:hypothetical protein